MIWKAFKLKPVLCDTFKSLYDLYGADTPMCIDAECTFNYFSHECSNVV